MSLDVRDIFKHFLTESWKVESLYLFKSLLISAVQWYEMSDMKEEN